MAVMREGLSAGSITAVIADAKGKPKTGPHYAMKTLHSGRPPVHAIRAGGAGLECLGDVRPLPRNGEHTRARVTCMKCLRILAVRKERTAGAAAVAAALQFARDMREAQQNVGLCTSDSVHGAAMRENGSWGPLCQPLAFPWRIWQVTRRPITCGRCERLLTGNARPRPRTARYRRELTRQVD